MSVLPTPIGAHRLLGDGRGAALVDPVAAIDWWCGPDFDSPPRFWSLLDACNGGRAWFADARPVEHSSHPAGPTTRSRISVGGRRLEIWDGIDEDRLVRLVRCLDGPLAAEHRCRLGGFGLGPAPSEVVTRLDAAPGEWAAIAIDADGPRLAPAGPLVEELAARETAARHARTQVRLPGSHPERAEHTAAVLEACTYAATGAVVAAPTTSLPEAPGHDRQFDYRYAWLRDTALAAAVSALLGRNDLAGRQVRFLSGLGPRIFEAPVFDVRGGEVPDEREVPGVAGWAGSRPVRVGNAAKTQVQYDALGFVVAAVATHLLEGGRLDPDLWRVVRMIADRVSAPVDEDTSGIWELRRPRPLVSADIGRWIALDRAIWIARVFRPLTPRREWRRARDDCAARVLSQVRADGCVPTAYDGDPTEVDASALLIPLFGMLDRRDPRAHALVDAHLERLGAWPFVYRYEPGTQDGFHGREGAFLPCSWWAVSALAETGRVEEAATRADALCGALPALLPEEVDPGTGTPLGNTPLVWSHTELARALYLLDVARLRRRVGRAGLTFWRAARFTRARLKYR